MNVTRRHVILGASTVAALAALGVAVGTLPEPAPGHTLLGTGELVLVTAIADAFFPPGNPLGVAAREADVAGEVDRLLATELDPEMKPLFRYLIRGLDLGTRASRGRGFATLPLEDRIAILDNWSDIAVIPRRFAYEGIKLVIGMAFMTDPRVVSATGWAQQCAGGSA